MAKTRTSFKKGEIHNPKGRPPKGHSITETIKAMMDEKPEIKRALGAKILEMAMKGDITAMKTLWNYMDGMPVQASEISGKGGSGIVLNLVNDGTYIPKVGNPSPTSEGSDTEPSEV